ncbi:MAG: 2-nitropropane dioxygenase [Bacillales bacterium]|jgi:NAD(P)H-dependent flavin oxidoreductase YrpB (nitropropane dioxygenase family)|nr:2-nitropropane dioxygenase [Bacillales bacterium]
MNIKPLVIGDLVAKIPIIQGGMGVGVSLSGLAGAVAANGGIGIISSAQIGFNTPLFEKNPLKANLEALAEHIRIAKEKAKNGIVGVNIMTASRNYEEYVRCSVKNKVDLIISGAGLPIDLPKLVENSTTKIAPIVSSVKGAKILLKMWENRHNKTADAVIVEGPKAGGHLGFKAEELDKLEDIPYNFDNELKGIIEVVKGFADKFGKHIPVIFGGGVATNEDMKHFLDLGCDGVQIASRFVATEECDAHENFKQAFINATKEKVSIVKSPVGMPGRAILNDFIKETKQGNIKVKKCYQCLTHCDPLTTPYCITKALINSVKGDVENGLVFCGEGAYQIQKMSTVAEVIEEIVGTKAAV